MMMIQERTVRGILSRLTVEKYHILVPSLLEIYLENTEVQIFIINAIVEKASLEPNYFKVHMHLLGDLKTKSEGNTKISFSHELQKLVTKRINEVILSSKERIYKEEIVESRRRAKKDAHILIGRLYDSGLISAVLVHLLIIDLFNDPKEDNIEILSRLLSQSGSTIDREDHAYMNMYVRKLANLRKQVKPRVRFLIEDMIILRENNWVPCKNKYQEPVCMNKRLSAGFEDIVIYHVLRSQKS
jgi:hypothetical protein